MLGVTEFQFLTKNAKHLLVTIPQIKNSCFYLFYVTVSFWSVWEFFWLLSMFKD